jgi:hypothetical protein
VITVKEAIETIKLLEESLHPATAPRWNKSEIEEKRKKVSQDLLLTIELLNTLEREGK